MIGVIVLTHGKFGEDLVKTACGIMHESDKVMSLNLSRRLDFQTLRKMVSDTIEGLNADQGVLMLIDAYGGTSYNTTLPLMNSYQICLVTGVSLPMVLSALTNRHRMPLDALAKKVAEDAEKDDFGHVEIRCRSSFFIGRTMVEKLYTITNRLGLHARPASLFVKTTGKFQSSVRVIRGEQEIDGKSIMGLLMLAAGPGTQLKIIADGADETQVLTALDDLFARRFDDDAEE